MGIFDNPFGASGNFQRALGTTPFFNPSLGQPRTPTYRDMFRRLGEDSDEIRGMPNLPQTPQEPSLLDRYREISGKNKNFQDLMSLEAPNPQDYKPSKWRRLGAALVGGATGFAEGPSQGFNTALDVTNAPYEQANSLYREKFNRLGALAGIESDNINRELKGLEIETEEGRFNKELELKQRTLENVINNDKFEQGYKTKLLEQNGIDTVVGRDGITRFVDKTTGQVIREIKTDLSPEEQAELDIKTAGRTAGAVSAAREPYEVAGDARQAQANLDREGAVGDRQLELERARAANRMATLRESLRAKFANNPDQQLTQRWVNAYNHLDQLVRQNPALASIEIITQDENGMPIVAPDSIWDSTEEKQAKAQLRALIAGGVAPSAANNSGTTASGGRYTIRER